MLKKYFSLVFLTIGFYFFPSISQAAQAPHYTIHAEIDTQNHRIRASQSVVLTNTSSKDITEVYFHIYPNRAYTLEEKTFMLRYASYFKVDPFPQGFDSVHFDVFNLKVEDTAAEYKIDGKDQTLLKVTLPKPLAAGSSATVSMDFTLDIPHAWGRFGWHEDVTALARWYPILAVLSDEGWEQHPFYPFHRPFF